ncbi:threonine/homoserine/homoserine lactone efflux protein [Maribacter spongiicola]|uniref:Threonine/homoserine/homoserine lactone efflux protein n=1 Tax=Maribacter spongiicola TaxID=1206753 RepID=A0A4R7JZZ2_9FLAO|nr:LysE family translocator [Maribacter spongiicola]TDT43845.1 threonine/homoserine/homoserine lactone efflux protein [Maribacter spongiicola]
MGIENFITFMITALLFVMTPGLDTIFILNKSIGQGRKSGVYASLGINTGVITHTLLAALGLSVVLASSPYAFLIIKYSGAFYLLFLGITSLRKRGGSFQIQEEINGIQNSKKDFLSGFLTNTLNPKVALFFIAFFPQFITPTQINNPVPYLLLGFTYALIGIAWCILIALFASGFSLKIKNNPNAGIWLNKIGAVVFILMGLKIAFT